MVLDREIWARALCFGLLASVSACRDAGAVAPDTDTDTDTDTGGTDADSDTDTDTDTDTETDSDGEPMPVTTELTVDVAFANEMMMTVTNSLHVWVLRPEPGAMLTCSDLVADVVDPYDLQLVRLADHVSTTPAEPVVIPEVEIGDGFVYVEGVSVGATAELAGCEPVTLVEPSTSIEIVLGLAGTFDCDHAATEDGAPCDDGVFCTVGETCSNGTCEGGNVRDCSILADQCNAANCTETDGCAISPVPNDTSCSDGLACTEGDSCQEGSCLGLLRDCDAEAELCTQSTGCIEPTGECVFVDADEDLPCDDGLFCTIDTICVSGVCVGNPMDCPGDECNLAECVEEDAACTTSFADTTTACIPELNECTEAVGLCDGAGACTADPANEGGVCDLDGSPGVCEAGICV